jgi:hypothetical protein
MKTERQLYMEKVLKLASLAAWSNHAISAFSAKKDVEAADSLNRIIKAMEDPELIKAFKEVRDWAMIMF